MFQPIFRTSINGSVSQNVLTLSFINNMHAAISRTDAVLPTKLHGAKSNRKNVFDVHVELIQIN